MDSLTFMFWYVLTKGRMNLLCDFSLGDRNGLLFMHDSTDDDRQMNRFYPSLSY